MPTPNVPPLVAIFLVTFDQKVGYTISWQQALLGLDLSGVEYKSLPSGIHEVQSDLVYFSHRNYIGLTAFVRSATTAEERNASFAGVGILVKPTQDWTGEVWRHVEALQALAQASARERVDRQLLENHWIEHRANDGSINADYNISANHIPLLKDINSLKPSNLDDLLSLNHPLDAFPELLKTFGALIFPLHRHVLRRKRILLLCEAPVLQICKHVHNINILSHFSQGDKIQPSVRLSIPSYKLLFNIGIADIDQLAQTKSYIACTTDSIIADKPQLYDVVVKLPRKGSSTSVYPSIFDSDGKRIKATQYDVDRHRRLLTQLSCQCSLQIGTATEADAEEDDSDDSDKAPLLQQQKHKPEDEELPADSIEIPSWTGIAYETLSRWTDPDQTDSHDTTQDIDGEILRQAMDNGSTSTSTALAQDVRMISLYFALLNSQVLTELQELNDHPTSDSETVEIAPGVLRNMGLNPYSLADRQFVEDALLIYCARVGKVTDVEIRLCGLRIC